MLVKANIFAFIIFQILAMNYTGESASQPKGSINVPVNVYDFHPYESDRNNHGAESYPHNRHPHAGGIGGGKGTGLIPPSDACVVSRSPTGNPELTAQQFIDCVERTSDGDWIWIENDVVLDLTGRKIEITRDVIIAGGRNSDSEGALIKFDDVKDWNITVRSAQVRFSGLRFHGAAEENIRDTSNLSRGLHAEYGAVLIVDNSELKFWGGSAISINHDSYGIVHHNIIEENMAAWGYGVTVCYNSHAMIEANIFKNNRHAIAGCGHEGDGYHAGWNLVKRPTGKHYTHFPSHDFDMHGGYDKRWGTEIAGNYIEIYNNTFEYGPGQNRPYRGNIVIRGKPAEKALIRYNRFEVIEPERPIRQVWHYGNFDAYYFDNTFLQPITRGWYVSWGGKSLWYRITTEQSPVRDYYFDFIIDDTTHIFKADGSDWSVTKLIPKMGMLYPVWTNTTEWTHLESNPTAIDDIGFGDFNGDGYTDILVESEGIWHIRWSKTGEWSRDWNTGKRAVRDIRFGDFNGDGRTDVFCVEIKNENGIDRIYWMVSYGAESSWQIINSWEFESEDGRKAQSQNLAFGNFIDNGKTDVFAAWDGKWWINEGGSDDWKEVEGEYVPINKIAFGDFNGNGLTDVFTTRDDTWFVRWNGNGDWQPINGSRIPIEGLAFGDLSSNGITDVLSSW